MDWFDLNHLFFFFNHDLYDWFKSLTFSNNDNLTAPSYKNGQPVKTHALDSTFDKAGPSQMADSMDLSVGPLSQLTPTTLHSSTKPRKQVNSVCKAYYTIKYFALY